MVTVALNSTLTNWIAFGIFLLALLFLPDFEGGEVNGMNLIVEFGAFTLSWVISMFLGFAYFEHLQKRNRLTLRQMWIRLALANFLMIFLVHEGIILFLHEGESLMGHFVMSFFREGFTETKAQVIVGGILIAGVLTKGFTGILAANRGKL